MIYLDNAATTQPLQLFAENARELLENNWFNPSAVYKPAVDEKRNIERTRELCETAMGGKFHCTFTSGGTESAMLALWGAIGTELQGKRILSTQAEHPAVYENLRQMEKRGAKVVFVETDSHGVVDQADFAAKLREDTALISIMHVSNITGGVNPITELYRLAKEKAPAATFHCDGVQGFAKLPPPECDIYTASAHKINALKGVGMLFVRQGLAFSGVIPGGGQESGVRSGTENTFGIASLRAALAFWRQGGHVDHMAYCKQELLEKLAAHCEGIIIHSPEDGAPHILHLSILGVGGEIMLHSLEKEGILISTGSACSSRQKDNRISQALHLSKEAADSQIRLSFTHDTPLEQMGFVADKIAEIAEFNRKLMKGRR